MTTDKQFQQLSAARCIFDSIKSTAKHPSKLKNLDLLWKVLDAIRAEQSDNYSIAEIARRLKPLGGPKTQSLRNAQGNDFRAIIDAYSSIAKTFIHKANATQLEQAIAMVADPSVRVVLKEFFAENKRLKHENDQLRSAFKTLSIGAAPNMTPAPKSDEVLPALKKTNSKIAKSQLSAIQKGLDPARLRERNLVVTKSGAIEDSQGNQLFPPGFATSIMDICNEQLTS